MEKLPWFPFYPRDFFQDEKVQLMQNAQIGIYLRLLAHQWQEGSIPADSQALALIAHVSPSVIAAEPSLLDDVVQRCFLSNGDSGRLLNPRLDLIRTTQLNEVRRNHERTAKAREILSYKRLTDSVTKTDTEGKSESESESESDRKKEKKQKQKEARSVAQTPRNTIASPVSDADWLMALKANPAYQSIDIDLQISKLDAWLSTQPHLKKTRRRIVNWLNRIEKPMISGKPGWRTT